MGIIDAFRLYTIKLVDSTEKRGGEFGGSTCGIATRHGRVFREDPRRDFQEAEVRDRPEPRVRDPDRRLLPTHPRPRARRLDPVHGASAHAEGQADLPVHVSAQERLHLLRERSAAGTIPAGDRHHEGLRWRLASRGRHRTELPNPNPITPPPQPTGRTENPSSCLFYCP